MDKYRDLYRAHVLDFACCRRDRHAAVKIVPAFLVVVFLLLAVAGVAADPSASGRVARNTVKIIPVHDGIYRSIDLLYREAGLAPPSGSRPWSIDEWERVIDRIPWADLSPVGRTTLRSIQDRLRQEQEYRFSDSDTFQLDLALTLALEGYAHTNRDDFTEEEDWVFGYTRRSPSVLLSLEIDLHDWLYLYSDMQYGKNRYAYDEKTDTASSEPIYNKSVSTNLHTLDDLDFETPYRGFFAVGGDRWNLAAGRDLMKWGHGISGNFVLNDHLDYHDMVRFVSYHDRLKVEATWLFFDHADFTMRREEPSPGVRMFLAHRLEYRPWRWLSFALTENVMYQNDHLDLRFLNPLFVYHNLNNRSMFNAIASAEVEVAPVPGLTLLYQYSMYQARAPLEGGSQPDAMGHLAGYRLVFPRWNGYLYHELEGVYSDTYMYQRDLIDMKVMRRQFVIEHNFATPLAFLGYPYGGDVWVLNGLLGYHHADFFDLYLELFYMQRGEIGIDTVIEGTGDFDLDRSTPSGTVEHTTRAGIGGEWQPMNSLTAYSRLDFIHVVNKGNQRSSAVWDLQFVLGARYRL
jgi:hypothetical protein